MVCPVCQADNPPSAVTCEKCSTPFPLPEATLDPAGASQTPPSEATLDPTAGAGRTEAWSVAVTASAVSETLAKGQVAPGTIIGDRYEIVQLLGQGGMGAVYKARDIELERLVALKLIRPDLASHPEILRRFKQELILAREVTHRNVVRIFDLGQARGIRFITMEYVEGRDLRSLIHEKGKLTPEEAVPIFVQIAAALEAAHHAGVVHRDLKPQNIMVDPAGRVYVMDFGVARSLETPGMTQTGALMGTPEYMSPEQAKGQKVDARSDLFSLGIIFYETLSGVSPFKADTAMATMFKRTRERATPLAQTVSGFPAFLSGVVSKCLEIDLAQRYQSAREIIEDLEKWKADVAKGAMNPVARWLKFAPPLQKRLVAGIAAALLLVAAYPVLSKLPHWFSPTPKAAHPPVSVLVADFTNHTGDPIFDGTLEPMFNVALEGASFVNAYSRESARKLAQKLPNPTDKLEEQSARLVAVGQGLATVVTGSLSRRGDGYELSVEALDARTGNTIAKAEINASNKDELLLDVPKLAAPIRKALGDTTPESAQLSAAAGAFTAASLEVVHDYSVGMEQQFAGNKQGALESFSKAAELDPNFARAYAGMAAAAKGLGRPQDAEKYTKLAMEHVDRMTERERYRIRGLYYLSTGNWEKCVEEYSELVKQYSADNTGHNNLAYCYKNLHNRPKVLEELQRAVEILPNNQPSRMNLALYLSYTGNFPAAEREAKTVLQVNSSYVNAYQALAYAQVGQGQLEEAIKTYRQAEKVSNLGQSLAAPGLADIALYEGRFGDAAQLLEQGAAADVQAGRLDSAAADFALLGYTQVLRKQKAAAIGALQKALANSKTVSTRFLVARVYVTAGETAEARKLAASLASEPQFDSQAYAKLIEGEALLQEGSARQAIPLLTQANSQLDTWIGHFDLGRAYLKVDSFVEADSEFDRCLKRRSETFDLFDYVATYGYLPEVYYYLGRAREGLKSPGAAADSYRTYLSIRGKAGEDPLLPEVRRRLGQ